jgi:hypothetical protein
MAVIVRPLIVVVVVGLLYARKRFCSKEVARETVKRGLVRASTGRSLVTLKGTARASRTSKRANLGEEETHAEDAHAYLLSNTFFALFFCYPSFCQLCMASLQCTPSLSHSANESQGEFTVLLADDRVSCENQDHDLIQNLSGILIALVGFGAPLFCAVFLKLKYMQASASDFNFTTNGLIAHQLSLAGGAEEAKLLVRDICKLMSVDVRSLCGTNSADSIFAQVSEALSEY